MERALLSADARRSHIIEHDLAGLLRGDLAARYSAFATAITNGFMSPNEARRTENMPPREGGDEFLQPLNMGQSGGSSATA
ncbi:MAG: phage portal protein [Rhizobiaceae bacterium]